MIYKIKAADLDASYYEASRFLEGAEAMGITLEIYAPDEIEIVVTGDSAASIYINGEPAVLPDFVLPRMGSGTTYFALAIIRHLERLGVPCINTSESIEKVKDKLFSHQLLVANNLPVPKTMLLKFPVNMKMIERNYTFPVVIKTLSGSLGRGVFLAETRKQFMDLARMIEVTSPGTNIILQEMVESSRGMDLRVFVVGGRVIGCMKRTSGNTEDFRANFSNGGSVEYYELTRDIEWLALEATKTLGLDIAGVDLLFDVDGFKVCEVNSSPMFKGMEMCVDVDVAKEIFDYVSMRIR